RALGEHDGQQGAGGGQRDGQGLRGGGELGLAVAVQDDGPAELGLGAGQVGADVGQVGAGIRQLVAEAVETLRGAGAGLGEGVGLAIEPLAGAAAVAGQGGDAAAGAEEDSSGAGDGVVGSDVVQGVDSCEGRYGATYRHYRSGSPPLLSGKHPLATPRLG